MRARALVRVDRHDDDPQLDYAVDEEAVSGEDAASTRSGPPTPIKDRSTFNAPIVLAASMLYSSSSPEALAGATLAQRRKGPGEGIDRVAEVAVDADLGIGLELLIAYAERESDSGNSLPVDRFWDREMQGNGFWLLSSAPYDLRRLQVLGRVERRRWTARVAAGDVNRADPPSYDAMTRFLEKGLYE